VRHSLQSPAKQEFAVSCGRFGARAADGVRLGLEQEKWK
jgi:hypothetical protein